MHYADLADLIRHEHIVRVEDLMAQLPPDFLAGYTLVYDSLSSQRAHVSPQWPRMIIYGNDATFLMAVTKSPATPPATQGEDSVETIEYDATGERFLFRKLVFDGVSDPLATEPAVNPSECTACHGADPRPNWESYNLWPGAFGSISRLDCDTIEPGTPELQYYQAFLQTGRQADRYKALPAALNPTGAGCPTDAATELTVTNAENDDPNAQLTQLVTNLNHHRIHRLVTAAPTYDKFQYVWLALAKECVAETDLETYFPAGWAAAHGVPTYQATLTQVEADAKSDFAGRLTRFTKFNRGSTAEPDRIPVDFMDSTDPNGGGIFRDRFTVAAFKTLADRMGLDMVTDRWATAFAQGRYNFTTPTGAPQDLFATWSSDAKFGMTCDQLQKASVAGFQ